MNTVERLLETISRWRDAEGAARQRASEVFAEESIEAAGHHFGLNTLFETLSQPEALLKRKPAGVELHGIWTCPLQTIPHLELLAGIEAILSGASGVRVRDRVALQFFSEVLGHAQELIPHDEDLPALDGASAIWLSGQETQDHIDDLALDLLLFHGASPASPKVVFAPEGRSPEPLLQACAALRGHLPSETNLGTQLRMRFAFALRKKVPHMLLDDGSLLITRGEPIIPPEPLHVRWVVYTEKEAGWNACKALESLNFVLSAQRVADFPRCLPGRAHAWLPAPGFWVQFS